MAAFSCWALRRQCGTVPQSLQQAGCVTTVLRDGCVGVGRIGKILEELVWCASAIRRGWSGNPNLFVNRRMMADGCFVMGRRRRRRRRATTTPGASS